MKNVFLTLAIAGLSTLASAQGGECPSSKQKAAPVAQAQTSCTAQKAEAVAQKASCTAQKAEAVAQKTSCTAQKAEAVAQKAHDRLARERVPVQLGRPAVERQLELPNRLAHEKTHEPAQATRELEVRTHAAGGLGGDRGEVDRAEGFTRPQVVDDQLRDSEAHRDLSLLGRGTQVRRQHSVRGFK